MSRFIIGLLFLLVSPLACAEPPSAFESVRHSTDVLLARLKEVQPIYESDPERFFAEVDDALDPHIDFEGFAKRVMAKHYRKASEEQQATFQQKFRVALIRTYATALLEFDNQDVVVIEPKKAQKKPDRAVIEIQVHARSGAIYPVVYQLGLQDNKWMLRNVVVNGINIGLQFRSQFNAYMQRYRGDVDKVIENWAVDVGG